MPLVGNARPFDHENLPMDWERDHNRLLMNELWGRGAQGLGGHGDAAFAAKEPENARMPKRCQRIHAPEHLSTVQSAHPGVD